MARYRASWVLPIDRPPIAGGVVTIDRGVIVGVSEALGGDVEDLGSVAILPGLVNAHTHLELSWMRGQVPPRDAMPVWAASLLALRRGVSSEPSEPIVDAIAEAHASGTCLVGDVTNTFASCGPLADSELSAHLFREVIGFNPADPDAVVRAAAQQVAAAGVRSSLRSSLAAHAPYSVAPSLLVAIASHTGDAPLSIHLGESEEEVRFLRDGSGPWRALLEQLGAWNRSWIPPACGPVEYLDRLGLVKRNLVAVHGVRFTDGELARLADVGATVVTCPRSNRWTGAGVPPIERFFASGVRVAIGTDSLASADDLNLFAELAEVRRLAPSVPASAILHSATRAGAEALGFDAELGSLAPGARARTIAVRLPPAVTDVEEYLLSGIEPADISWIDPDS